MVGSIKDSVEKLEKMEHAHSTVLQSLFVDGGQLSVDAHVGEGNRQRRTLVRSIVARGGKGFYVLWADFAELFVKHKRVQQTTLVIVDSPKEQGVGLNLERALNLLKDTGEVRSPRRHHGESPRTRPRNPLGQNNMSGKPLDQSSASVLSGQPLFQAQMGDMSGIATTTSAGGVCRDLSVFPRPVANRNHGIRQVPGPHLLLGYHNHIAFDCD